MSQQEIKQTIHLMNKSLRNYKLLVTCLEASIEIIRHDCEHVFKSAGNDSHYEYFECEICGFKTKK